MRHVDGLGQNGKRFAGTVKSGMTGDTSESYRACNALEAYWASLDKLDGVPNRMDFDPRGVEATLSHTFVAERVARSVVRLRVAGSGLNSYLGMDVRGMPITAFFDPETRDTVSEACTKLFDTPAKVTIQLSVKTGFGQKAVQGRLVLLPMRDVHGNTTRVVGCLETAAETSDQPLRFKVDAVEHVEIGVGEAEVADPSVITRPKIHDLPRAYAFAEPEAAGFERRRATDSKAPVRSFGHLRLVVDND